MIMNYGFVLYESEQIFWRLFCSVMSLQEYNCYGPQENQKLI